MVEMTPLFSTLFPQYKQVSAQNPRNSQKILSFRGGIRYLTGQYEVGLSGLFLFSEAKKDR